MPEYKSRVEIAFVGHGSGGGDAEVEYMRRLRQVQTVARLEQRWGNSWAGSLQIKLVLLSVIERFAKPTAGISNHYVYPFILNVPSVVPHAHISL